NAGSTALSFLTQKSRWASLVAQAAVQWAFLAFAYVVGIGLALVAATFYPDGLAMSPRGWAYLAAYLLVVLLWVTMATAFAVLSRSVAVSVVVPITWMLLIVQLTFMDPMLEAITPWLPFNACHMLIAQALGEAPVGISVWPPAVALLVPALDLAGA